MYKKTVVFVLCVLLIAITVYFFNNKIKQKAIDKFYLEDKYYNNGNFISVDSASLNKTKNESFVLFTYNNYCNMAKPCEEVFQKFMKKYKIDFLYMKFEEFRNTSFYKTVKYAPSIIVVKKGTIVAYLDAESDEDLNKYQNVDKFEKWLNNYIYFSK